MMLLSSPSPASGVALPRYLLRSTLLTLLPLIVFELIAGWLFARHERQTFERGTQERVRALSTAVDAELRGAVTTLQAMAQSSSLRTGDLAEFHAMALRVKNEHTGWLSVNLALPDTRKQVINLLRPYGTDLAVVTDNKSFDAVLATQRPAIGDLVQGPLTKTTDFPVRVPVLIDGQLRYVLTAVLDPALIQSLLVQQRFPADWVGVVVDRRGNVVARSLHPEATVGKPASQSLRDAPARERESFSAGTTLEGAPVYTPFFTSAQSGWSVAMGVLVAVIEAGGKQALW